jgi:peptide/nickel transport system permease protein
MSIGFRGTTLGRVRLTAMERWSSIGLVLLALAVVLVPLFSRADPLAIGDVLSLRLLPPGARDASGSLHLLGTDRFGRDLFVRMMLAGRISLAVGVIGSLLAGALGTFVGAIAAWRGGVDSWARSPRGVAARWTPSAWPSPTRCSPCRGWCCYWCARRSGSRGSARWWSCSSRPAGWAWRAWCAGRCWACSTRAYVDAATALGASSWRVLLRHALPNALGPAIVATTLGVGNAILLESGLSFLGMGIQPPQPSWGNMIAGGRDLIVAAPWVAIAPGSALIVTVLACTLLGDALRDRLAGETGTTLRERV